MAHCNLCGQVESLLAEPNPPVISSQDAVIEIAALLPGGLVVNMGRVRWATTMAQHHTGVKQATVERALFNHLSAGNPFGTWLGDASR